MYIASSHHWLFTLNSLVKIIQHQYSPLNCWLLWKPNMTLKVIYHYLIIYEGIITHDTYHNQNTTTDEVTRNPSRDRDDDADLENEENLHEILKVVIMWVDMVTKLTSS